MEAVVGLLLLLFGVSHGVGSDCDGRRDGAQCYGALGGTVVFRLMDNALEIPGFDWIKDSRKLLNWINYKIVQGDQMENRFLFVPSNGTFKINNLSRNDSGNYTLNMFDPERQRTGTRTLQLTVQAPVSSVHLVSECLSQGEKKVSCSSEGGDSLQYSWTLDGHTLTHTELLSGNNETNIITLKQDVSGRLVCSVRNHISSVSREEDISTCGFIFINCTSNGTHISKWVYEANNTLCVEPTTVPTTVTETTPGKETESVQTSTHSTSSSQPPSYETSMWNTIKRLLPIIGGVFAALVILLVIGVAIICNQRKKKEIKAAEEDEEELTYADVRVVQKQRRQVEQRAELEVEYGQVKFSERPRQQESAEDDCVYAKVRKGR